MANPPDVDTGCTHLGKSVHDFPLLPGMENAAIGENQLPSVIHHFVDDWPGDIRTLQFQVLLHDNRTVSVRGHGLRYLQNPSNPSDLGSYAIVTRTGQGEVVVALFRVAEVTGIFSGGLVETARASASVA
jgi:hypothetical protein